MAACSYVLFYVRKRNDLWLADEHTFMYQHGIVAKALAHPIPLSSSFLVVCYTAVFGAFTPCTFILCCPLQNFIPVTVVLIEVSCLSKVSNQQMLHDLIKYDDYVALK